MEYQFFTNYTDITFLDKIKDNLRHCKSFDFSVSFIKKAGLVLLFKDIEAAVERGCKGRIITSTYQNFTDIESLKSFYALMGLMHHVSIRNCLMQILLLKKNKLRLLMVQTSLAYHIRFQQKILRKK